MLTSVAYDRYVAICNPLLYKVSMSHQVCLVLSLAAYVMGFAGASACDEQTPALPRAEAAAETPARRRESQLSTEKA